MNMTLTLLIAAFVAAAIAVVTGSGPGDLAKAAAKNTAARNEALELLTNPNR